MLNDLNILIDNSTNNELVQVIQTQFVKVISDLLDVESHQIDVRQPLSSFNLDSIKALILAGELSKYLGDNIYPTLIYEHLNIETLAHYLAIFDRFVAAL
jgi:8-amino-7-oxononanoate synthase